MSETNRGAIVPGAEAELAPAGRDLAAVVARALESDVVLAADVAVDSAVDAAKALRSVSDAGAYERAVDLVRGLQRAQGGVEDVLGTWLREPTHRAWKTVTERIRTILQPADVEIARLKRLAADWQAAEEKRRREEEQRIRAAQEAEERRLREEAAAEERKRAEAEAARAREEAARQAAAAKDAEERERLELEAAAEQERIRLEGERAAAAIVEAPSEVGHVEVLSNVPKVDGATGRDNWKAEVESFQKLVLAVAEDLLRAPDMRRGWISLVKVDATALGQLARAQKGALNIPGVRAWNDRGLAVGKGKRS